EASLLSGADGAFGDVEAPGDLGVGGQRLAAVEELDQRAARLAELVHRQAHDVSLLEAADLLSREGIRLARHAEDGDAGPAALAVGHGGAMLLQQAQRLA